MEEHKITFHSDEVQEIMGRKPSWILKWGITTLLSLLVGIVVACYFIKYPETAIAAIRLTSDNPPADLVARTSGILDSVFVADGDTVPKGRLIALIASTADFGDVLAAEEALKSFGSTPDEVPPIRKEWSSFKLGNLQADWTAFLSLCNEYRDYKTLDRIGRQKKLLSEQLVRSKEYYRLLEQQRRTLDENMRYEKQSLDRDSLLFARKAISKAEYETGLKSYISRKNEIAGFEANLANARLNQLQLEQQILELDVQRAAEVSEYQRKFTDQKLSLSGDIALWKEQFAIISPSEGRVSLQNVWSKGQKVSAGDLIASVIPADGYTVMGRLKVPSAGFGKVAVGQEVNIKLNGFPYLEYGILKGVVSTISSVPENGEEGMVYTVNVALPDGLESTYHKRLPFVQDMDGSAEIVTEDRRLIEQFILPIRSLFVNR